MFDINLNNCLEQTILRQGQLYLFVAQQSLALQCICYSKLAYSSKFIGVFSHEKYNLIGSAVRYIIASDEQTAGQADRRTERLTVRRADRRVERLAERLEVRRVDTPRDRGFFILDHKQCILLP